MTFTRCVVALLCLVPSALAQKEVFGTTDCVVGVATEQLSRVGGRQSRTGLMPTMPARWGTREVIVDMTIDLKFSLSKLVGEPVWGFVPRYSFGSGITIEGGRGISREQGWAEDRVEVFDEGLGKQMRVSAALFDKIRVRNFYFYLETEWRSWDSIPMPTRGAHFNMHLPGITANAGEWGWDVPGSPSWKRALLATSKDLVDGHQHAPGDYLDAKAAKAAWNKLIRAGESGRKDVLKGLRVYRVDLDLSRFTAAVEKVKPGATKHLFDVGTKKWNESALDWQLRSLIQGVQRDAAERRDPNGAVLSDNRLNRRMAIVDEAVRELAGPEQKQLVQAWQDARREIVESPLESDILLVGRSVSELIRAGADEASPALLQQVQRVADQLESNPNVSTELGQRWEEIQRVSELLGGLKRSVYAFAVAQTSLSPHYFREEYAPIVLRTTTAGRSWSEEDKRRADERERERDRAVARRNKARRTKLERTQQTESAYRPEPARTDVHRLLVETEMTTPEIEVLLQRWAASVLVSSQQPRRKITSFDLETRYRVYLFMDVDAAEKAAVKMKCREVAVPPPAAESKPAAPK